MSLAPTQPTRPEEKSCVPAALRCVYLLTGKGGTMSRLSTALLCSRDRNTPLQKTQLIGRTSPANLFCPRGMGLLDLS